MDVTQRGLIFYTKQTTHPKLCRFSIILVFSL